ncbi:Essential recombination function protein [uncultured Caudovirales phage]|uniref:Essential recombination function protein n=1 Tax=uncultured Caudovirales phage TaxID=2100421 RepID=A0A6J5LPG3_9CAUD|nr:Essential recombination function protein [uncultured Caudovirales phage]CAB4191320.1 Essential recombination function protein [uncultured Caudovirales phage]
MTQPQIYSLLTQVMTDAGAVKKGDFNSHQKFNFRGIDAVINAVSPALRKHGVVVVPTVITSDYESVQVGQNRTVMGHARITITYTFYAPDGSNVAATVSAESMDSGDKATAKAYSVAFRTALLQTLCLPTDEADPDSDTYERSTHDAPQREQAERIERPQQAAQIKKPAISPATKTSGALITEAQTNFINNLLHQTECDEQLLIDQFGSGVSGMSSQVAKKVIDALLSVRKGEAEIVMGSDGKFVIG